MRVIQVTPSMAYGDAIGNDILAKDRIMRELGWQTEVYAGAVDARVASDQIFTYTPGCLQVSNDDLLLYHMSTGWPHAEEVMRLNCKKVICYHNITPPKYFCEYSVEQYRTALEGERQLRELNNEFFHGLADSEYNRRDLLEAGYECPIDIIPVVVDYSQYDEPFNQALCSKYDDEWTNLLFVGRVAPNKKQEDLILSYYYYKKFFNTKSRLFIVGSYTTAKYHARLLEYMKRQGVEDVFFSGHISFADILSYYRLADAFVCMSEHEGFCVPLLEAMYFKLPIIAYDGGAVSETLGGSGLLLQGEKDPLIAAGAIDRLMRDGDLCGKMIERQKNRLDYYSYAAVKPRFVDIIRQLAESRREQI